MNPQPESSSLQLPRIPQNNPRRHKIKGISKLLRNLRGNRSTSQKYPTNELQIPPTDGIGHSDEEDGGASNRIEEAQNELQPIRKVQSEADLLPPIDAAFNQVAIFSNLKYRRKVLQYPEPAVQIPELKPAQSAPSDFMWATAAELREAVSAAEESEEYSDVAHFFNTAFHSYQDINAAFKNRRRNSHNSGCSKHGDKSSALNQELVSTAYEVLMCLPQDVQKSTLKSVINALLSDQRSYDAVTTKSLCREDLRAYLVLIQNPQFRRPSTYVVYAHLQRQLATLCDQDQALMTAWFAEVPRAVFLSVVITIQQFISVRLFPPRPQDLPPMDRCAWWIPCAVRVLAMLNAANNVSGAIKIPFTDFYNLSLDHWDLMSEFYTWESPTANSGFSFCQYPFILSINAKRQILEGHAEQQMIATARDCIIGNLMVASRRTPDMDMLFLTITVRRDQLLQDSLEELSSKQGNFRKKLRVQFAGEPGLDMGGLTKEWFQLVVRQIFLPDYGMFVYHPKSEVYWFSTAERNLENLQEYHLIGVLMGLAVYNGVILDIRFPVCCYKKLLSPAVVPRCTDMRYLPLGVAPAALADLAQVMPDTSKGLQELLNHEGDVQEDYGLSFQIDVDEFGSVRTVDLKDNGADIPVTNENRTDYVNAYVDWLLNKSIYLQFRSFYMGFHSVCASNVMLMLRAEEVEMLVCGSLVIDMEELQESTTYDGYCAADGTIRAFWELVFKLPTKHQRRLLLFVTGSDRVPVGGIKELKFKISKMVSTSSSLLPTDMLPISHTCFNQLILPDYQDKRLLRAKLAIALAHGTEGFGLE